MWSVPLVKVIVLSARAVLISHSADFLAAFGAYIDPFRMIRIIFCMVVYIVMMSAVDTGIVKFFIRYVYTDTTII